MKPADRARLIRVRANQAELEWIFLRDLNDPKLERSGSALCTLAGYRRFQAMVAYVLDHDPTSFRQFLREAVELELSLLRRYDAGDPISEGLVTLLQFKELFMALALGDAEICREFAERLISNEQLSRDQRIHRFSIELGMCLCAAVLCKDDVLQKWADEFEARCQKPGNKSSAGFASAFIALLQRDDVALNEALSMIAKSHGRLCASGGGLYLEDKDLSVWGVGMANLARWRGLDAQPVPPLIPAELLVPVETPRAHA